MITNKELSKLLGVSEATVSLVLNGKAGISEKTRKNVLERIRELGYGDAIGQKAWNSHQQSLETINGNIKNIAFVLYKVSGQLLGMNSFFPLIFDGIESTARKYGYNLTVLTVNRENIQEGVSNIKASGCEGYVVFATEMQAQDLFYFERLDLPFVLFDNFFAKSRINSVKVNNEQGIYTAVSHLRNLGHVHIGYLSSGLAINSFYERKRYTQCALEDEGLKLEDKYCFEIGYPSEIAETGMRKILEARKELPTAFLCDNDLVAIGAMQAVKKVGLRIPEDIAFVGYDDRPICELIEPGLTTIRLPRNIFGAAAVEKLISLIQQDDTWISKLEINGELIVRESSAGKQDR